MILCSQLTFNRGVGYFNLTGQTTVEDQMINERAYIIGKEDYYNWLIVQ